jgi:hypothetical protein
MLKQSDSASCEDGTDLENMRNNKRKLPWHLFFGLQDDGLKLSLPKQAHSISWAIQSSSTRAYLMPSILLGVRKVLILFDHGSTMTVPVPKIRSWFPVGWDPPNSPYSKQLGYWKWVTYCVVKRRMHCQIASETEETELTVSYASVHRESAVTERNTADVKICIVWERNHLISGLEEKASVGQGGCAALHHNFMETWDCKYNFNVRSLLLLYWAGSTIN